MLYPQNIPALKPKILPITLFGTKRKAQSTQVTPKVITVALTHEEFIIRNSLYKGTHFEKPIVTLLSL